MFNNYSQDIPYTKQTDAQEYIGAFDVENESIDFTTLENYSNSEYVLNTNALQKVKNNINVMQSNFNNDIISDLDDKQELFQSWVNNLSANAKPWESGAENKYYKGDIVTHFRDAGSIFLCLEDCDGSSAYMLPSLLHVVNAINNKFSLSFRLPSRKRNFSFSGTYGTPKTEQFSGGAIIKYDGQYNISLSAPSTSIYDNFTFIGSKEMYDQIHFTIDDSPWLRIHPRGKAGLDAFEFNWRGEWQSGEPYTIGMALPPEVIYQSIVWYQVGRDINFYACIQNVTSNIPPDQDTTHWVKLFTQKLDGFVVLDSMPNQAWFNDDTNPSVFGVKQSDSITIKVIDRIHSESASNPQYLKIYTVASNVVDANGNNLNTLINNLISNTNI